MKMRENEEGIHLLLQPLLAEEVNLKELLNVQKYVGIMVIVASTSAL